MPEDKPEDKSPRPQKTTTLRESWQPAANATGADPAHPPKNNPIPTPPEAKPAESTTDKA